MLSKSDMTSEFPQNQLRYDWSIIHYHLTIEEDPLIQFGCLELDLRILLDGL